MKFLLNRPQTARPLRRRCVLTRRMASMEWVDSRSSDFKYESTVVKLFQVLKNASDDDIKELLNSNCPKKLPMTKEMMLNWYKTFLSCIKVETSVCFPALKKAIASDGADKSVVKVFRDFMKKYALKQPDPESGEGSYGYKLPADVANLKLPYKLHWDIDEYDCAVEKLQQVDTWSNLGFKTRKDIMDFAECVKNMSMDTSDTPSSMFGAGAKYAKQMRELFDQARNHCSKMTDDEWYDMADAFDNFNMYLLDFGSSGAGSIMTHIGDCVIDKLLKIEAYDPD